jgi:predicted MFS family arabinose efflux permease
MLFFTPLLAPIAESMGVSFARLGALVSVALVSYSLAALPAGLLADRLGWRVMILLSMALPSLGCLVVSAGAFYPLLATGFMVLGLGAGLYHPSSFAMLSTVSSGDDRGRCLGIHGAGGNIGMMLAPFMTAAVATWTGWRGAFLFWGLLGLGLTLLALPTLRTGRAMVAKTLPRDGRRPVLSAMLLWTLVLSGFYGALNNAASNYLPAYLQTDVGQVLLLSGVFTAFMFGCGIAGQVLGGYWTDRFGLASALYGGMASVMLGVVALPFFRWPPLILLSLLMLGLGLFVLQPVMAVMVAEHAGHTTVGLCYGLFFSIQYVAGAAAVFLSGFLADSAGLSAVFMVLGGVALVALGLSVAAEKGRSRYEGLDGKA